MIRTTARIRAWGNSFGVVVPKEELKAEDIGVDDEVEITVKRKENPLRAAFGILKNAPKKTKKSTDEILAEIDKELDSRYDEL